MKIILLNLKLIQYRRQTSWNEEAHLQRVGANIDTFYVLIYNWVLMKAIFL